jgi:hypothetical protein
MVAWPYALSIALAYGASEETEELVSSHTNPGECCSPHTRNCTMFCLQMPDVGPFVLGAQVLGRW